jgi:hypothetical protein
MGKTRGSPKKEPQFIVLYPWAGQIIGYEGSWALFRPKKKQKKNPSCQFSFFRRLLSEKNIRGIRKKRKCFSEDKVMRVVGLYSGKKKNKRKILYTNLAFSEVFSLKKN